MKPEIEPTPIAQNESASIANVCMYLYICDCRFVRVCINVCMYGELKISIIIIFMYVCTVLYCMYVLYVCMYCMYVCMCAYVCMVS